MLALWQGMAIYQYVNIEAASRTPVIRASIQAQSGEVVSWKIWRFNAPLPIVYARAQIENTIIDVGAIGPAAEEIEELLGQLTRLTPEAPFWISSILAPGRWPSIFSATIRNWK